MGQVGFCFILNGSLGQIKYYSVANNEAGQMGQKSVRSVCINLLKYLQEKKLLLYISPHGVSSLL